MVLLCFCHGVGGVDGVDGVVMAVCWHWGMLYSGVLLCCDAVMLACLH